MRTETRDIDRSEKKWAAGPWDDEPDKVQWVDETTGLDCLIVRQPDSGHLCGYVGVPPGHPWHGVPENDVRTIDEDGDPDYVSVHGGLTFADRCNEDGRICHVPEPGRPADVWWLGFDCMHYLDTSPRFFHGGVYRDIAYVEQECRRLAEQAARVTGGKS